MSDSQQDTQRAEAVDTEVWKLLPWLVTDELPQDELDRVCEHLKSSRRCRQELLFLSELRSGIELREAIDVASSAETPKGRLSSLMRRIDRYEEDRGTQPPKYEFEPNHARRPLVWAVAAQAAVIALLAGVLLLPSTTTSTPPGPNSPTFVTLSDPSPRPPQDDAQLRLIFEPGTSELKVRQLLLELDATIQSGPSRMGAYSIRPTGERALDELIQDLRRRPIVAFAEKAAPP